MLRSSLLAALLLAASACGTTSRPDAAAGATTSGEALRPLDELLAERPLRASDPAAPLQMGETPREASTALGGRFIAVTERPGGPGGLMGATALQTVGALVRMASEVNAVVAIRRDVPMVSAPCGEANAFYSPAESRIVLCDELVAQMDGWFSRLDAEAAHNLKQGALEFIVGHEMGHALVHQLELPVLGRNEDAADLLATVFALDGGDLGRVTGGMMYFLASGLARPDHAEIPYWDVHSVDEQRVAAIACLLYGADPFGNVGLVENGILPAARAQRCGEEYATAVRDVRRQLAPYKRSR